jgi:predicted transcriptional regulator
MKSTSSNVRIGSHTHALLSQLAEDANESMQAIIEKAVERGDPHHAHRP